MLDTDEARRKAIVALSTIGAMSMVPVSLLQLGVVQDLPDPPIRGFDSRKVNLSQEAYVFGMRDGPLALAGFVANIPLASLGPADRALTLPWLSLGAAAKAFGEAVGALVFFWKMPTKEKAWCGYCITAAAASVGVFALTVPEALRALSAWRARRVAEGRGDRERLRPQSERLA